MVHSTSENGKKYKPPLTKFGWINPRRKLNEERTAMIDVVRNDLNLYTNTLINNDKILINVLPPSVQLVSKRNKDKPSVFSESDAKYRSKRPFIQDM